MIEDLDLDSDFDSDNEFGDEFDDLDDEIEMDLEKKLQNDIVALKSKAIALGLPASGYGSREKGHVDIDGAEKALAKAAELQQQLDKIKSPTKHSEKNHEMLLIVENLHALYNSTRTVTFRKNEEIELGKLSKLTQSSSDSKKKELGKLSKLTPSPIKKEYSGIDLMHIIPFDTLIFYKPIYKSGEKETSRSFNEKEKKKIRAWDLGVNDAYGRKEIKTSDDLKIENIDEVIYKEGYMYAKESIELRENLMNLILDLHRGVIPEDSIINERRTTI